MHLFSLQSVILIAAIASSTLTVQVLASGIPQAPQSDPEVFAGTSLPYPVPERVQSPPDSLETVFVNHVGRHGARFLSKKDYTGAVLSFLDGQPKLTADGERVRRLCLRLDSLTDGRWGALDAMGMEEQDSIGARFFRRYPGLFERNDSVEAWSSYVPRCVMSMDFMTHAIESRFPRLEMGMGSGPRFNRLLRFFTTDRNYKAFKENGDWKRVWQDFADSVAPVSPIDRLTPDESGLSRREKQELATNLYKVVAGSFAILTDAEWKPFFTDEEYRRLWECENLRHYLTYSWSGIGTEPMTQARPLLAELIRTIDAAAAPEYDGPAAILRFGHAETLMPLLCLMDIPGCRYVTDDWGSVAAHWRDYEVAPMAVNLQMALCRSRETGELYLVTYVNEVQSGPILSWSEARGRLLEQESLTRGRRTSSGGLPTP